MRKIHCFVTSVNGRLKCINNYNKEQVSNLLSIYLYLMYARSYRKTSLKDLSEIKVTSLLRPHIYTAVFYGYSIFLIHNETTFCLDQFSSDEMLIFLLWFYCTNFWNYFTCITCNLLSPLSFSKGWYNVLDLFISSSPLTNILMFVSYRGICIWDKGQKLLSTARLCNNVAFTYTIYFNKFTTLLYL